MPDNTALLEVTREPVQIRTIDLSKYRTGELADRLTELISVPEALRKTVKATALFAFLSIVACCLIRVYSDITLIPWLFICAYSLAIGPTVGLTLGVLKVIATAVLNIETILLIVLETTGKVAMDYEQVQNGKMRLPSGRELVEEVYDGIVLPVMEQAGTRAFGCFGKPLLWTYRRTIGSAVRCLLKRVNRGQVAIEGAQHLARESKSGLTGITTYTETIRAYTSSALEVVGKTGSMIRFYTMLPLYAAFFAFVMVATIPMIVAWYVATGEASP